MAPQQLATLLDQCVADITAGRKTLVQCLAEHPDRRADLEPLLRIALCIVPPPVTPDPVRKARARYEFIEALHQEPPATRPWWWPLQSLAHSVPQRRFSMPIIVAVAFAFMVATSGGAAFAAQDAQPGDLLYGLKTAIEQVQVVTASSEEAKAQAHLEIAAKRLAEVEQALEKDNGEAARIAAEGYAQAVAQAQVRIEQAEAQGKPVEAVLERLEANLERQQAALEKAAGKAAAAAQAALEKAGERAQKGLRRASERAPETGAAATADATAQAGGSGEAGSAAAQADASATAEAGVRIEVDLTPIADQVAALAGDAQVSGESYLGLKAKLEAAAAALARGQSQVAVNQLTAFHNQLEALHRAGHISSAQYTELLASYQAVMQVLTAEAQGQGSTQGQAGAQEGRKGEAAAEGKGRTEAGVDVTVPPVTTPELPTGVPPTVTLPGAAPGQDRRPSSPPGQDSSDRGHSGR
ncbi:MAG: hypothetical protein HY689_13985 [Chloroflexi bacterium]|nr:hypothetical protein [Chloroflexota bacterium]